MPPSTDSPLAPSATSATVPSAHRRLRSGLPHHGHTHTHSSRSLQSRPHSSHSVDPFSSFLTHHHTRNNSLTSPLGFTASLAMRRAAQVAKLLSNLKKSPLLNPTGVTPVSQPPASSLPPSSSPSSAPSFLPHLNALSHHPSLALLTYPASTYLAHQNTPASLVNIVVSGRVRFLRDGVLCAEVSRGGLIGIDGALMGSERYRRYRRGQRRRRQRRQKAAALSDPLSNLHPPADEAEQHAVEDEKELRLDVEEVTGKKRRRLRVPHYCTVQCVDEVECIVFPASVLLSYVESDRALLSHAFRFVTAVHHLRRSQWRDGERRLHHLWGHTHPLTHPLTHPSHTSDPDLSTPVGQVERKVLGTAGFAYFGLSPIAALGEERVRHYTHEQNVCIEHPMFALAKGEGGGPVERRRVRVTAAAARGGDRQQREEVKKVKEKEAKARKVRRVIDAIERSRRAQAPALLRATSDDFLDSDGSESDYDSEEEEEMEADPLLADERYAAAINQHRLTSPVGRRASRAVTPKFTLNRRLNTARLIQPAHTRGQGRESVVGGGGGESPGLHVQVLPPTARDRQPSWTEEEETKEAELQDRVAPMLRRRSSRSERKEEGVQPFVDRSFLRPTTPSTARTQRDTTTQLLTHWQHSNRAEETDDGRSHRRGREERRLDDEKEQLHLRSSTPGDTDEADEVVCVPPDLGVERLCLTDYSQVRDRVQSGLKGVMEAEEKARKLTGRLAVDAQGVSLLEARKKGGAVRSAVRSLTEVEVWTIEAEQRFGREEQQLRHLLAWTEDQVVREVKPSDTLVSTIPYQPQSEAVQRLHDAEPKVLEVTVEKCIPRPVVVVVEQEDEEGRVAQERPIAFSPPSTLTSPFRLLHQQHLTFPSHPSAPSSSAHAQSARPSTASPAPKRDTRSATPLSARSVPRPRTAGKSRDSALLRTGACLRQSTQSLVNAAGKHGVGWQTRLSMLQEVDIMDESSRQVEEELQPAIGRPLIAGKAALQAVRGIEGLRRAKVTLGGLGAVCEPAGVGVERPRPARPHSSASIRRYADKMAGAI